MEPIHILTFGEALRALKDGGRVARAGWQDTGLFLFLVSGSRFRVNREPLLSILGEGTEVDYQAHIDQRRADGSICVWHPRHDDMLAEDWGVVSD